MAEAAYSQSPQIVESSAIAAACSDALVCELGYLTPANVLCHGLGHTRTDARAAQTGLDYGVAKKDSMPAILSPTSRVWSFAILKISMSMSSHWL